MKTLKELSNEEVLNNLSRLNSNEVEVVAEVLIHLLEVERRKLYAERGYSSLFSYCVEVLKYCDGMAGRRVAAVRCIEKVPELLTLFKEQKLSITTIALISKILTSDNKKEVLSAVLGKGKTYVEEYVSRYLPEKNTRESIKPLPSLIVFSPKANENKIQAQEPKFNLEVKAELSHTNKNYFSGGVANSLESKRNFEDGPDFEIKLKTNAQAIKKLRRVQELRGKNESLGELFEVLLDEYLNSKSPEARIKRREKREQRKVQRGNEIKVKKDTTHKVPILNSAPIIVKRHIPQRVRDSVYRKYEGRCAYVAKDGTRCSCRKNLQVDHIRPFGKGGTSDESNLRLLCPAHNRYVAESVYGRERMEIAKRSRPGGTDGSFTRTVRPGLR